jgi:hypothetical protein
VEFTFSYFSKMRVLIFLFTWHILIVDFIINLEASLWFLHLPLIMYN